MSEGWYWCYRCRHRVSLPAPRSRRSVEPLSFGPEPLPSEPVCPSCGEGFLEQEAAARGSPLLRSLFLGRSFSPGGDEAREDLEEERRGEIPNRRVGGRRSGSEISRSGGGDIVIADDDDDDADDDADDDDDDLDMHMLWSPRRQWTSANLRSIFLGFAHGTNHGDNDSSRSLPASRAAVDAMPVLRFSGQFGPDDMPCAVCKDVFLTDVEIRQMPCNHFYHSECILPWLALHSSCPVCRQELPSNGDGDGAADREEEEEDEIAARRGFGLLRMSGSVRGFAIFGFDSPSGNSRRDPDLMVRTENLGNETSMNAGDNLNDSAATSISDDDWHSPLEWLLHR